MTFLHGAPSIIWKELDLQNGVLWTIHLAVLISTRRAVFKVGKGLPSQNAIDLNSKLLGHYAAICQVLLLKSLRIKSKIACWPGAYSRAWGDHVWRTHFRRVFCSNSACPSCSYPRIAWKQCATRRFTVLAQLCLFFKALSWSPAWLSQVIKGLRFLPRTALKQQLPV